VGLTVHVRVGVYVGCHETDNVGCCSAQAVVMKIDVTDIIEDIDIIVTPGALLALNESLPLSSISTQQVLTWIISQSCQCICNSDMEKLFTW